MFTQRVQKAGQILPMYVVEVAKDNPGVTGLFMSGILSAALRYYINTSVCKIFGNEQLCKLTGTLDLSLQLAKVKTFAHVVANYKGLVAIQRGDYLDTAWDP